MSQQKDLCAWGRISPTARLSDLLQEGGTEDFVMELYPQLSGELQQAGKTDLDEVTNETQKGLKKKKRQRRFAGGAEGAPIKAVATYNFCGLIQKSTEYGDIPTQPFPRIHSY